jgi:hypothetical protein
MVKKHYETAASRCETREKLLSGLQRPRLLRGWRLGGRHYSLEARVLHRGLRHPVAADELGLIPTAHEIDLNGRERAGTNGGVIWSRLHGVGRAYGTLPGGRRLRYDTGSSRRTSPAPCWVSMPIRSMTSARMSSESPPVAELWVTAEPRSAFFSCSSSRAFRLPGVRPIDVEASAAGAAYLATAGRLWSGTAEMERTVRRTAVRGAEIPGGGDDS